MGRTRGRGLSLERRVHGKLCLVSGRLCAAVLAKRLCAALLAQSLLVLGMTARVCDRDDGRCHEKWLALRNASHDKWLDGNLRFNGHLGYETLHYEVISERPRIYYYPNFLSHADCDKIREMGLPHVKASRTEAGLHEKVRSSRSYFFSQEQERSSPEIMGLKHRVEAISHVTLEYQEEADKLKRFLQLQIQHYNAPREKGQQQDFYIPHFDWIPSRPRVATVIIYLHEPEEGGETIFPFVRHNSSNRNANLYTRERAEPLTLSMWEAGACSTADKDTPFLRVRPKKGAALLFYSLRPDNTLDPLTIHGSCPVLKGQKTVLQQWLSTIWIAPAYSPGLQALWRRPSFRADSMGSVDASGRQRPLRRQLRNSREEAGDAAAAGEGAGDSSGGLVQNVENLDNVERGRGVRVYGGGGGGICSGRGLLRDCEETRQFSVSFMVALEFCSDKARLRLSIAAGKGGGSEGSAKRREGEAGEQGALRTSGTKGERAPAVWDVSISNCLVKLTVPGSSSPPLSAPIAANNWAHVTVMMEDLSDPYDTGKTLRFRSHLIVQGHKGAQTAEGVIKKKALNWNASRVCLYNDFPDHADFEQVYVLSRQLSAAELKFIRQKSSGDHVEPRPGMR